MIYFIFSFWCTYINLNHSVFSCAFCHTMHLGMNLLPVHKENKAGFFIWEANKTHCLETRITEMWPPFPPYDHSRGNLPTSHKRCAQYSTRTLTGWRSGMLIMLHRAGASSGGSLGSFSKPDQKTNTRQMTDNRYRWFVF